MDFKLNNGTAYSIKNFNENLGHYSGVRDEMTVIFEDVETTFGSFSAFETYITESPILDITVTNAGLTVFTGNKYTKLHRVSRVYNNGMVSVATAVVFVP